MQRVQPANEDAESSDEDGGIEAGINGHARGRDGAGPAKRMAPGLIGSLALGGAATWAGLTVFTRLSEPPGGGSVALATPPQTEAVAPHTQPPPPAGSMVEAQPSITPMARHTKRQRVSCRASGFNEVATRGGGSSTPGACWSLEQMLQHASEHGGGHCFFAATRCDNRYKPIKPQGAPSIDRCSPLRVAGRSLCRACLAPSRCTTATSRLRCFRPIRATCTAFARTRRSLMSLWIPRRKRAACSRRHHRRRHHHRRQVHLHPLHRRRRHALRHRPDRRLHRWRHRSSRCPRMGAASCATVNPSASSAPICGMART